MYIGEYKTSSCLKMYRKKILSSKNLLDCLIDCSLLLKWVFFSLLSLEISSSSFFYLLFFFLFSFAVISAHKMEVSQLGTETTHIIICTNWTLDSIINSCINAFLKHISRELVEQNSSLVHWERLKLRNEILPSGSVCKHFKRKNEKCNDYFDSRVFLFTCSQMETVLAFRMESYLYVQFPEEITFK